MLKWLSVAAVLVSTSAFAEQSIWQSKSDSWSSGLNARTEITLSRLEYDFAGLQDQHRELSLAYNVSSNWMVDTRFMVRKHDLEGGLCRLNMRSSAVELMPTFKFQSGLQVGLGYQRFLSGDLNVGSEFDFALDHGSSVFISTRLFEVFGQDQFEVRLANTRLDAIDNALVNPDQQFSQSSVKVMYRLSF